MSAPPLTAESILAMAAAELRAAQRVDVRRTISTYCSRCTHCTHCSDCSDCYRTKGLGGARYVVLGVQLTSDQYSAVMVTLGETPPVST